MANTLNPSLASCISLFREHPEDVIAPINSASDTLFWLEESALQRLRQNATG